jgi:hypothetical protein
MLSSTLFTAFSGLGMAGGSQALGAEPGARRTPLEEQEIAAKAVAYQKDARKVNPGLYPT